MVTWLVSVTAVLLLVNLALKVQPARGETVSHWIDVFNANAERNVPTVWNALVLFGVSGSCLLVAGLTTRGAQRKTWLVAAAAPTFMALDELLGWHERLFSVGGFLAESLPGTFPSYLWLIAGMPIALTAAVAAFLWMQHLPADVRGGLRLAVVTYFAGAIGVEAISGWIHNTRGVGRIYHVVTAVEEGLEMLAGVLAIVAILRMLRLLATGRRGLVLRADY